MKNIDYSSTNQSKGRTGTVTNPETFWESYNILKSLLQGNEDKNLEKLIVDERRYIHTEHLSFCSFAY